jgi:hypothetical protein
LEKDPKKRLRDIGDVWMLLDEPVASAAPPGAARTSWRWPAAAAVLAVAALLLAVAHFGGQAPAPPDPVAFEILAPPNAGFTSYFTVSPDGKKLAFTARSRDGVQLWVRSFDSEEARPITRTAALAYPFWSPDSKYLRTISRATCERFP